MRKSSIIMLIFTVLFSACGGSSSTKSETKETAPAFTGAKGEVKLITIDPGHFHAALVQKTMFEQVDPVVHVYAPEGKELQSHLKLIEGYNTRDDSPTSWETKIYTGSDYLEKMLSEKPGNVMVTAGNNAKKTDYILKAVEAGINVLADKPMVINPQDFKKLEQAFKTAEEKGVMLYDIMTERYEITTILQRELALIPEVFGTLETGTPENPAITKESVHHFFKFVSGNPLIRPTWYFDVKQQGEGIVDVTTHLVDLIQWEAFPEVTLKKEDIEIVSGKRWTTDLTPEMFEKSTQSEVFPDFLQKDVEDGILKVYSNSEIIYKLKGIHAKVSVIWDFEAPEGTGDTHYSIMRGTKSNLIIKQGADENFKPTLYVEPVSGTDTKSFEALLEKAVNQDLQSEYPGLELKKHSNNLWIIDIPEKYKVGHEAHFGQVAEKYLGFLAKGNMPEWEVPNMIVKYYTISEGLKAAMQ